MLLRTMNCPAFANEVEDKARSCPSCGATIDAPGLFALLLLAALVAFGARGALAGRSILEVRALQ